MCASSSPSSRPAVQARPHGSGEDATCKLPKGLYLIGTPIGNLGDLTPRAKETLAAVDLLLCEDTRVTQKLLSAYGIKPHTQSYHTHNAQEMHPSILKRLAEGQAIGLVSDAGMPCVSDPGESLVDCVRSAGFKVTVIPGPSAVLSALSLSGLSADRFMFIGFLPPKAAARRSELSPLAQIPATLIFFESPQRLAESLADMSLLLGADRPAAVVREITKLYEETRTGTLQELADFYQKTDVKGEIVVVINPPAASAKSSDIDVETQLKDTLKTHSVRDAVAIVSARTGRSKRDVYALAIALERSP